MQVEISHARMDSQFNAHSNVRWCEAHASHIRSTPWPNNTMCGNRPSCESFMSSWTGIWVQFLPCMSSLRIGHCSKRCLLSRLRTETHNNIQCVISKPMADTLGLECENLSNLFDSTVHHVFAKGLKRNFILVLKSIAEKKTSTACSISHWIKRLQTVQIPFLKDANHLPRIRRVQYIHVASKTHNWKNWIQSKISNPKSEIQTFFFARVLLGSNAAICCSFTCEQKLFVSLRIPDLTKSKIFVVLYLILGRDHKPPQPNPRFSARGQGRGCIAADDDTVFYQNFEGMRMKVVWFFYGTEPRARILSKQLKLITAWDLERPAKASSRPTCI